MKILKESKPNNNGDLVRLIMETNMLTNWNKFYVEVFYNGRFQKEEYLFTLLRPAEKYYRIKVLELQR